MAENSRGGEVVPQISDRRCLRLGHHPVTYFGAAERPQEGPISMLVLVTSSTFGYTETYTTDSLHSLTAELHFRGGKKVDETRRESLEICENRSGSMWEGPEIQKNVPKT